MNPKIQVKAFTLVEIMVVIVIMLIIVSAVIGLGKVVQDNAKEKLTQSTIQLLLDALQEYKSAKSQMGREFYFPVESPVYAGMPFNEMVAMIGQPVNLGSLENMDGALVMSNLSGAGLHDSFSPPWSNNVMRAFNSCELLYAVLNDVAACRTILSKLPDDALKNLDEDAVAVRSTTLNRSLCEFYDAWGTPLNYHNQGVKNFPLIQSAGKDQEFGTDDDIYSTDI